ncbi:DUF2798 domain-containing protein [Pontibacter sp. E15-1]|uniref:DUF2798 domain-containing protein n=1 Tax=Pontibacter sp. E15-1 TaxID=2919918 RepID=UPI001F4F8C13|nr:DUF2798 domain-containing protein [Pontibacter sp. E15-1]MCJ8166869.1 DUF2798 domain-containing protein [Pontibacter sp. E15-1]
MKKQVLSPQLKRSLLLIGLVSLFLGSALQIYTFGFSAGFAGRWLNSTLVFFVLIAVTVLAIVPAVNYVASKVVK